MIEHVPVDGAAFRRSATELVGSAPQEPDLEGYQQWREAGGGVCTLPIDEAVASVETTLAAAPPPPGSTTTCSWRSTGSARTRAS